MKQQWEDLRALFDAALPLPPGERAQLLEERCGGDSRFRRELEKLLHAHDEGEAAAARRALGRRRFGVWETIQLVGRGGTAEVHLAQRVDGRHEQRAALKVMTRSLLSPDYMDRFRRERETLVRLEHPNIARLYDGGMSGSGEPYLVLEYVDGVRLDDYCDDRSLPAAERLRLFLALCSAVECAHRNLILHRDIKPGNVLVTREGVLKLVDFGTAPLTPSFASPEQLRGDPVTTASDVYGLGMTLDKLLAGPSAQRKELKGDLDAIILKAIERDPARRYASVPHLAEDIVRHLEKRPVQARR
jgi:eukaryotic-like serine/threonine-protein kinase